MFTKISVGLVGLLLATQRVSAEFATECRNICLDPVDQNILITECTIDGSPKGKNYQWGEFDLNKILARSGGYFNYVEK